MATRQETNRRREALRRDLREQSRRHAGAPVPAPPVRDLAEKHALSVNLVCTVLHELTEEGVLHTVPRVGTFIGAPQAGSVSDDYLLLLPPAKNLSASQAAHHRQMRIGFEDRIAGRGGTVLTMNYDEAAKHLAHHELPALSGVFDLSYQPRGAMSWTKLSGDESTPRVRFATHESGERHYDLVAFDDKDGGRQATRHLMNMGHSRIAFLAVHSVRHDSGRLDWSSQREAGWREVLSQNSLPHEDLSFHPRRAEPSDDAREETRIAREAAAPLIEKIARGEVTAIVAANDPAAQGVLQALREARVPSEMWPGVVGFDGELSKGLLTSLRLPWEEIGRAAADLLHERGHGVLPPPPVTRCTAMKLIPRLTSRKDWSHTAGHVALAATI